MKQRIEWLAILRGMNILLVVMVHICLVDLSTGENHAFCTLVSWPFHAVRMPLFIFASGGLLYLSRIQKGVETRALYKDKFQRITIPFLFFVTVYYLVKVVFNGFAKTPTVLSWRNFLESFIYFRGQPSEPFWFLAVLMIMMLLYPLFCYLCESRKRMAAFLLFCSAVYFIDSDLESRWNVFYIMEIQHYLIYFFFGIFFFRYQLYRYLSSPYALALLALAYGLMNCYYIPLLTSLTGILAMCALCLQIARWWPRLFSSFREYIFPIYLMSMPFQVFVELILWKHLFYNEQLFYAFYILNLMAGLYIPVVIAKAVERCPVKIVRLCFGLQ